MHVILDDISQAVKDEPKSLIPKRPKIEPGNSEEKIYDPYDFIRIKEIIEPGQIVKKETIRGYFNGEKYVKCSLCELIYKPSRHSVGPFTSHLRQVHQIVVLDSKKSQLHSSPSQSRLSHQGSGWDGNQLSICDAPKIEVPGKHRDYDLETFDFSRILAESKPEAPTNQRTASTGSSAIGKVPCMICQTDVLLRKLLKLSLFWKRNTKNSLKLLVFNIFCL